jgi:hypothetical protein
MQKRACAGASVPQAGHVRASEAPQAMQKLALAGFSAPQLGQFSCASTP